MNASSILQRQSQRIQWVSTGALALGLLVLAQGLHAASLVEDLRGWFEGQGPRGALLFVGAYVLLSLACVPAFVLTLAGGGVYGLALGVLLVAIGQTLSAGLSYWIARHLARETIERWAEQSPRMAALDCAIANGGWKIVLLSRLSPFVPFGPSNYLFGLSGIGFLPYVLMTPIGMFPVAMVYVYLGHIGAITLESTSGPRSVAEWALLGCGLAATAILTAYIALLTRRNLRACQERGASRSRAPSARARAEHRRWRTILVAGLALAVWAAAVCVHFAQA